MDIELQESSPRRMIRCTFLKKKIFYPKVYVKTHEERRNGDREGKKARHPKSEKKIPRERQKFPKFLCERKAWK